MNSDTRYDPAKGHRVRRVRYRVPGTDRINEIGLAAWVCEPPPSITLKIQRIDPPLDFGAVLADRADVFERVVELVRAGDHDGLPFYEERASATDSGSAD